MVIEKLFMVNNQKPMSNAKNIGEAKYYIRKRDVNYHENEY